METVNRKFSGAPLSARVPRFPRSSRVSPLSAYRTVMSYQCPAGNCTRQPRFSNPRVTFNGAPTGIEGQRDNARTGDAVADTVASFRMVSFAFRSGFE